MKKQVRVQKERTQVKTSGQGEIRFLPPLPASENPLGIVGLYHKRDALIRICDPGLATNVALGPERVLQQFATVLDHAAAIIRRHALPKMSPFWRCEFTELLLVSQQLLDCDFSQWGEQRAQFALPGVSRFGAFNIHAVVDIFALPLESQSGLLSQEVLPRISSPFFATDFAEALHIAEVVTHACGFATELEEHISKGSVRNPTKLQLQAWQKKLAALESLA